MLDPKEDAFGQALLAHVRGEDSGVAFERDDGYIDVLESMGGYFTPCRGWTVEERAAMRLVRGGVLDIGCGSGRHSLHLQEKGHRVVATDNSPLALRVCRMRGIRRTAGLSATEIASGQLVRLGGRFDTILMLGNNLGLFGGPGRARWMLSRFRGVTNPGARILGETFDPHVDARPVHRAYHRFNRKRGRLAGQARIRVRHRRYATPWFDYLFVSRREFRDILKGSGWFLERTLDGPSGRYIAVIERTDRKVTGRSSR